MKIYEFHFYDDAGRRPTLDLSDCPDDGRAAEEAFRALGQHGSCRGVDIYQGERLVARLERGNTDFSATGAHLHGA